MSYSLGDNASACIGNVIRTYLDRCKKVGKGGESRKPILSKRIFNGGFHEASLFPALHQGMLKKMLESGIGRPRGSFFYLEGTVGSARWRSPFAGLDTGMSRFVSLKFEADSR